MRGRQILMESLIAQGVSYIFGNPGTTESPIIDSLLDYPQLNYIEALHEGVAVGAASYRDFLIFARAVERLEGHQPAWPMPKVFRLTNKGKLTEGIFRGDTMNTPSMLCVEDALDGLRWAERMAGLAGDGSKGLPGQSAGS